MAFGMSPFPLQFGSRGGASSAPDPFEGGDLAASTILAAAERMATGDDTSGPAAGGTLTINDVALSSYDYTIHDGDLTVTSGSDMADFFTATKDTRSAWLIVKGNLAVESGATLTPAVRKLFAVVYATGDISVSGEISMSRRGANHNATGDSGFGAGLTPSGPLMLAAGTWGAVTDPAVPVSGGAGGAATSGSVTPANPGAAGSAGGTGGGGSGGQYSTSVSGAGAAGTMFSGGGGGGGCVSTTGGSAVARGGKGGDAVGVSGLTDRAAGGGAGNLMGSSEANSPSTATGGQDGTGGLLVVIGDTLSGTSGLLTADGGAGTSVNASGREAGGGGSGGGSVTALMQTNGGGVTARATGGAGGTITGAPASQPGGDGGAGTARILVST